MGAIRRNIRGKPLYKIRYESPLGTYILVSSDVGLACVKPEDQGFPDLESWTSEDRAYIEGGIHNETTALQLDAYFKGEMKEFDVPLDMHGTTFQQTVWKQLTAIPYGKTWSYGEVAAAIGRPTASRAVGHANGCNPVSIIVPCHRVIGSTGKLVGYGGGLDRKRALLALEVLGEQQPLV